MVIRTTRFSRGIKGDSHAALDSYRYRSSLASRPARQHRRRVNSHTFGHRRDRPGHPLRSRQVTRLATKLCSAGGGTARGELPAASSGNALKLATFFDLWRRKGVPAVYARTGSGLVTHSCSYMAEGQFSARSGFAQGPNHAARHAPEVGLQGPSWAAKSLGEESWRLSCWSFFRPSSFTFSVG